MKLDIDRKYLQIDRLLFPPWRMSHPKLSKRTVTFFYKKMVLSEVLTKALLIASAT